MCHFEEEKRSATHLERFFRENFENEDVVNTFAKMKFKDENVSHMLMEDMLMFVNRDFYLR